MNAATLRDSFLGRVPASELAEDLKGTTERTGRDTYRHHMRDLSEDFAVEARHLVRVCDAVLAGELDPGCLAEIGFGMIASDHFTWDTDTPDGELVGETLFDWAAPEVNFALNVGTAAKFRHRLLTGESTFTDADRGATHRRRSVE